MMRIEKIPYQWFDKIRIINGDKSLEFEDRTHIIYELLKGRDSGKILICPDYETQNVSFEQKIKRYNEIKNRLEELKPWVKAKASEVWEEYPAASMYTIIHSKDAEFKLSYNHRKDEPNHEVILKGEYRKAFQSCLQKEYEDLLCELHSF